jgi:hypothetical protein
MYIVVSEYGLRNECEGYLPRTSIGLLFLAVLYTNVSWSWLEESKRCKWRGAQTEPAQQQCYRKVLCDAQNGLILSLLPLCRGVGRVLPGGGSSKSRTFLEVARNEVPLRSAGRTQLERRGCEVMSTE